MLSKMFDRHPGLIGVVFYLVAFGCLSLLVLIANLTESWNSWPANVGLGLLSIILFFLGIVCTFLGFACLVPSDDSQDNSDGETDADFDEKSVHQTLRLAKFLTVKQLLRLRK